MTGSEPNLLLITVRGRDRPGITNSFLKAITLYQDNSLLDISQLELHGLLILSFLVSTTKQTAELVKELLMVANKLEVVVETRYMNESEYRSAQTAFTMILHVVMVDSSDANLSSNLLCDVCDHLYTHGINIESVKDRHYGSPPFGGSFRMKLQCNPTQLNQRKFMLDLAASLTTICDPHRAKISIRPFDLQIAPSGRSLIVFGLSHVLVSTDPLDLLVTAAGGDPLDIRRSFESGEINFDQFAERRFALLDFARRAALETACIQQLQFTAGARETCAFLRDMGFKLAVVTSSATQGVADFVQQELGLDYALATESGEAGLRKVDLIRLIAKRESVHEDNVILVSSRRQPAELTETCGSCVFVDSTECADLRMILYLLGFTAANLKETAAVSLPSPSTPPTDQGVIFKITGRDRPGVLAAFFAAARKSSASVTELFQCNMQNILCLGMRLIVASGKIDDCVKEILLTAHKLDLAVSSKTSVNRRSHIHAKHILITATKFPGLAAQDLSAVVSILSDLDVNIKSFRKLTADLCALEIAASCPETTDVTSLRKRLLDVGTVDIGVQLDSVNRAARRVIVFDMDSTLIQQEVIDELGREAGVAEQVAAITEQAMRGELDFFQSLQARVSFLNGQVSDELFAKVKPKITLTPGAAELCKKLRALGFKTAVISGGFMPIARYVQDILGLDYAFANELETDNGILTGRTVGPVVTPQRKRTLMQLIAQVEGCSLDQVIAVGDGANDILMLQAAGLGVAFCAKPKVQQATNFRINVPDLMAVTFLLGISRS